MKVINKKNTYLLFLVVVSLLALVIVPTYAKFGSSYGTNDDVVSMALDFSVTITDVEEYERITIEAGDVVRFNIAVSNSGTTDMYYGIWYRMIEPASINSNISIGKLAGSETATSGLVSGSSSITATVAVINDSTSDIIVDIGVIGSETSTSDIEYLDGRYLISKEITVPRDIVVSSITIDGVTSDSLPTSGLYDMTYTCSKGSTLSWEPYTKSLVYSATSYVRDTCNLTFTTKTSGLKYLYEMPVGSYVAYEGKGGTLTSEDGTTTSTVQCQNDDSISSSSSETESPYSCLGKNAREGIDTNGNTYGYCYLENYKYYTTGWRIAYIDEDNNKAVIISAGSPECNTRTSNSHYTKTANALALKYCNPQFVDGDANGNKCTCTGIDSDSDGVYDQCSDVSADAWVINDNDFNKMTEQATGVAGGGYLYTSITGATKCGGVRSEEVCGYNNDLIDNGGYYWFASTNPDNPSYGVYWNSYYRFVTDVSSSYVLGLRPVISLSSSVLVTGGAGTMDDPYVIEND